MERKSLFSRPLWMLCVGLVLLLGAIAAFTGRYAWRRMDAVEYVENLRDTQVSYGELKWWPKRVPVPKWLRPVKAVDIGRRVPCDLRRLEPLCELESLCAGEIDDASANSLGRFPQLTQLHLPGRKISAVGVARLSNCKRLQSLELARTSLDNEGLKSLEGLPLVGLSVDNTAITDVGIESIAKIRTLTSLTLRHTRVTDAGVAQLASHRGLTFLDLTGTEVTEAGIATLAEVPLERLLLQRTRVTPEGLRALGLKRGLEISVSSPPSTEADAEALGAKGIYVELAPNPFAGKAQ